MAKKKSAPKKAAKSSRASKAPAKKRGPTPFQKKTAALAEEIKLTQALKKAKPGSAAAKKLQNAITLVQRIQKRGYESRKHKIISHDTSTKSRSADAVRKGNKSKKKSSTKGKKTKNTSKKTRSRSTKGKKKR